jgi:hypothetical protein
VWAREPVWKLCWWRKHVISPRNRSPVLEPLAVDFTDEANRLMKVASWFQTFKDACLHFQRFMHLKILKMKTIRPFDASRSTESANAASHPEYPNPQNSHYFIIHLENTITLPSPPSLYYSSHIKSLYSFFDWCIYGVFFDHIMVSATILCVNT